MGGTSAGETNPGRGVGIDLKRGEALKMHVYITVVQQIKYQFNIDDLFLLFYRDFKGI